MTEEKAPLTNTALEPLFGFGTVLEDISHYALRSFIVLISLLLVFVMVGYFHAPFDLTLDFPACRNFTDYPSIRICYQYIEGMIDNKFIAIALPVLIWTFCFVAIIFSGIVPTEKDGFGSSYELRASFSIPVLGALPTHPVLKRKDYLGYLSKRSGSLYVDAVRDLRTSMFMSRLDSTPQVLMLTSSLPGEGKTTISLVLSQNIAANGKKVLLIEGDLRRRCLIQYFVPDHSNGLISVLAGKTTLAETIVHDEILGVDVLLGEASSANAADILSSKKFSEFVNDARGDYDFIVIDTPPVLLCPDPRIIAEVSDIVLFVVEANSTSQPHVRNALSLFDTASQKVDGLVLNQISKRSMKRHGHYLHPFSGSEYYSN